MPMKPCAVEGCQSRVCWAGVGAGEFVAYSDEEGDRNQEERVGQERVDSEKEDDSDVVAAARGNKV